MSAKTALRAPSGALTRRARSRPVLVARHREEETWERAPGSPGRYWNPGRLITVTAR